MRIESAVSSISWIPSEAISGHVRVPMDIGLGHYDDPPPDKVDDLALLAENGAFRFANELRAAIEVEDGEIVSAEHLGRSHICPTDLRLGVGTFKFPPVSYPDIRPEPEWGDGFVRFRQTAGGRTGAPMPRRIDRAPFVRITAPTAWTSLSLTLYTDGRVEHEVTGASPFPRHWIYDGDGVLTGKSGAIDFKTWAREYDEERSPWSDQESEAFVTEVETALERELSLQIMRGGKKPEIRKLAADETLTEQGEAGDDLYLLLDGVLVVEVDGDKVAEVGPGAILGERAKLEGGVRTSTLRAVTPAKVAVAKGELDESALADLAEGHRREES